MPLLHRSIRRSPGSWVLIPQDMAASPTHRPQLSKVKQSPPPYLLSDTPTYLSKHPRVHCPRLSPPPPRHRARSPLPQVHISPNSSTSPLSCALAPDLHTGLLTCAHAPKSAHLFPNLPKTRMPQSTYTFSSQAHPPISHTASFPEYLPPQSVYTAPSPALSMPPISPSVRTVPLADSVLVSVPRTSPACVVQAVDPRSPAVPQVSA